MMIPLNLATATAFTIIAAAALSGVAALASRDILRPLQQPTAQTEEVLQVYPFRQLRFHYTEPYEA